MVRDGPNKIINNLTWFYAKTIANVDGVLNMPSTVLSLPFSFNRYRYPVSSTFCSLGKKQKVE